MSTPTQMTGDKGVTKRSDRLSGKTVAVGVCGGIGAVEVVKIIRELRRHGAEVQPYRTPSAAAFITDLSLSWAADKPVVSGPTAEADHLLRPDLVVVVPTTLNTLAKCSQGISDNPVTLLVASQLGGKRPVLFVPTMNEEMAEHPMFEVAQGQLKTWGATFFPSPKEEGRFKVPSPEDIANFLMETYA